MSKQRIASTVYLNLTDDALARMPAVDAMLVELNQEHPIGDGHWCEVDGRLCFREQTPGRMPRLVAGFALRNARIRSVARRYPPGATVTQVTLRRIDDFDMQWVVASR